MRHVRIVVHIPLLLSNLTLQDLAQLMPGLSIVHLELAHHLAEGLPLPAPVGAVQLCMLSKILLRLSLKMLGKFVFLQLLRPAILFEQIDLVLHP